MAMTSGSELIESSSEPLQTITRLEDLSVPVKHVIEPYLLSLRQ